MWGSLAVFFVGLGVLSPGLSGRLSRCIADRCGREFAGVAESLDLSQRLAHRRVFGEDLAVLADNDACPPSLSVVEVSIAAQPRDAAQLGGPGTATVETAGPRLDRPISPTAITTRTVWVLMPKFCASNTASRLPEITGKARCIAGLPLLFWRVLLLQHSAEFGFFRLLHLLAFGEGLLAALHIAFLP